MPAKTVGLSLTFFLALCAVTPLSAQPPLAPGEVLVERIFLPDAKAGSFAFGLPGGISFCYDPVRGGLNYVWTGGFVDLANVRPGMGKLLKPAKLLGPVVYRETGLAPLRRGDATRVPVVEFKGYTLRNSAVELRYTVDGALVTEQITARPADRTLVRKFSFDRAGADATWFYAVEGRPAVSLAKNGDGSVSLVVPLESSAP